LVEWPEKIEELIPDDALHLTIRLLPDSSRTIELRDEIRVTRDER
jgi:tRNA A37 threonylcarbamoyladenosine biosynthesis protein TsaE